MLNTIKVFKFTFIILLSVFWTENIYTYEVQEQGINLSTSNVIQNWTITQYYPDEIVIIRSSNERTGTVSIGLSGNLIKIDNNELIDIHAAFRYGIESSNEITGSFTSVSSSGDNIFQEGSEPTIKDGNIEFILDQEVIFNSVYISGALQIDIPLTLEDGTYNLNYKLIAALNGPPNFLDQNLSIIIVTTPVVQVEDIDFGRQIKGVGAVTRTSNITVRGKEGAELSYTLETSGEFVQAGGDSTIPFTSEIIADGSSKIVDGESTATLQVTTNISDDVDPGKYTGSVRVLVQHN